MVLTALLVPQVVHILQLLVLLEPMPVVQQRVIHVPVVLTALLVPQVVRILQLPVPLEPMPVGQQLFVIHVVRGNTTIKQVKRLNQLLVKVARWENTKTKREKHRVIHVVLESTTLNKDNQVVIHVPVVLTALLVPQVVHIPQLLVPLEPMPVGQQPFVIHAMLGNTTIKPVKRLNQLLVKAARWENTKAKREKHRVTMIV